MTMAPQDRRDRIKELREELNKLLIEEANDYGANVNLIKLVDECTNLKKEGKPTQAMLLYRNSVGCTLMEAKQAVEGM
jgi:ribosomal protein L7/L12